MDGMVELEFSPNAQAIITLLKRERGRLTMLIGDTGCCGYSNIFITSLDPPAGYEFIGEKYGLKIYAQPSFIESEKILVEAIPSEGDDSFSAETSMGYRLVMRRQTNRERP
jgi:hypothetical protein